MDKGQGVSRRDFIVKTGIAVGAAAALSSIPLLGHSKAKAAGAAQQNGATDMSMASVPAQKKRAWVMVIDLKKCDGCVGIGAPPQCTQSCINGHYVPDGQKWIEVFVQPVAQGQGTFFMPTPCYHCENAPCVNVCPVGATYHNQDGVVLIDQRRCIGCRMCIAACPYHRRFFNWGDPKLPAGAVFAEYTPDNPVPAKKGTTIKCVLCAHFLIMGKLPYCANGCPNHALYMGDLNEDVATNGTDVVQLTKFMSDNDAYRFKEELGTQPRVYYLPGHGQDVGRASTDTRQLQPVHWTVGGYDQPIGVWPWGGSK